MQLFKANNITRQTLAIYWTYTKRYLGWFLSGSIGAALAVIVQNMIPPLIVAKIFSLLQRAYSKHEALRFRAYLPYVLAYAVAMLLGVVFWRLQSFAVWKYEIAIRRDLADDIHNHLHRQSQAFHANCFGGSLVTQSNKFVNSYERLMDDFIWNIVPSTVTLV